MITNFVEMDFPTVTSRKCYVIKRNKNLLGKIHTEGMKFKGARSLLTLIFVNTIIHFVDGEVRFNPTDLHAPNYHVMGVDLRNIDEVHNKLKQADVDFSLPTIFVAECVLVYVEAQNCANLLKWLSSQFKSSVLVNYEQVCVRTYFIYILLI